MDVSDRLEKLRKEADLGLSFHFIIKFVKRQSQGKTLLMYKQHLFHVFERDVPSAAHPEVSSFFGSK